MKKLVSLMIAFVLMAGLSTGVAAADDAESVYLAAQQKTSQLSSLHYSINARGRVQSYDAENPESAEEPLDYTAAMDVKINRRSEKDYDMQVYAKISRNGTGFSLDMCMLDGWMYVDMLGLKTKSRINPDTLGSGIGGLQLSETSMPGDLTGFQIKNLDDGGAIINYHVGASAINRVLSRTFGNASDGQIEVVFSNLDGTSIINSSGYVTAENNQGNYQVKSGSSIISIRRIQTCLLSTRERMY